MERLGKMEPGSVLRKNGVNFRGKVWILPPVRKRSGIKRPLNAFLLYSSDVA